MALTGTPDPTNYANTLVTIRGIGAQFPTTDYAFVVVEGVVYVDWNNGEGMDSLSLADGDKLAVQYRTVIAVV